MTRSGTFGIPGVYSITNKLNKKIYIGSTVNLFTRLKQHLDELRHNKHGNPYLQNAFNKYGEENFEFGILEFNNEINLILQTPHKINLVRYREQYYLNTILRADEYKNKVSNYFRLVGYNIRPDAFSPVGQKISRSGSNKIKNSILNKKKNCKTIYMFDVFGNYVDKFNSGKEAAKKLNYIQTKINRAARNNGYCKGFLFSRNQQQKVFQLEHKPVYCYYRDLTLEQFTGVIDCAQSLGIKAFQVRLGCTKNRVIYKKYFFSYIKHDINFIKEKFNVSAR